MRTLSPHFLRNAKVSEFVKFKNFVLFFFHPLCGETQT
jgi:hypothetical protein